MINLITGTPGSGKTYLAIRDLVEKHFFWHKKDHCFYRKTESKKYEIFTNINGLKLPHKNLNEIFTDQKLTFDSFFNPEYQTKLHAKYPHIIYIIDECQQFIPFSYKNTQTILYFDTHRHFGDKIYLITQDIKKITISIQSLVEIEYRAVKSTFTIFGGFRYNIKSSGDIFETKSCRKDKRIFDLYTSFQGDDQEQKTNYLKYYVVVGILLFVAAGYYFYTVRLPGLAKKITPPSTPDTQIIPSDQRSLKTPQPPPEDPHEIKSYEIVNFALRESGEIIEFECPITNKWYTITNNPYQIVKHYDKLYLFIDNQTYAKLTAIKPITPPPKQYAKLGATKNI